LGVQISEVSMQYSRTLRAGTLSLAIALLASCAANDTGPSGPNNEPIPGLKAWSDPATWPSGHVPLAGDSVHIPTGLAVHLDTTPPALSSLRIDGTLVVDDKTLSLTTGWIVVGGLLRVGTEASPFTHKFHVTLTGSPGDANIDGMGNKVLGVSGTVDLHGQARMGWTHLAATAAAGSSQLELVPGFTAFQSPSTFFSLTHAALPAQLRGVTKTNVHFARSADRPRE